ncbi:MAG: hypothetical protein HKP31_08525, partial [Nitrosopumilus sp.]|nr:hypothetical protein [Nitrosopumilus sp.]
VMSGIKNSLTATKYRMAQYDTFRIKEKREYLSRQIVKTKIESQIQFLKSTENPTVIPSIEKLEKYLETIRNFIINHDGRIP